MNHEILISISLKPSMLATQCAVAGSPNRSPSTSPVLNLRRRKTLRMFLTHGG
ncbi:hypothetical protein Hanom_Chr12g01081071 [Helianthus anomalus]